MQITRITARNFRNLDRIDIHLIPGAVVVGENRSAKSNLVHDRLHACWLLTLAGWRRSEVLGLA